MDTKSRKFDYRAVLRVVCFALAFVFAALSTGFVSVGVADVLLKGDLGDRYFYDTFAYNEVSTYYLQRIEKLVGIENAIAFLQQEKQNIIDKAVINYGNAEGDYYWLLSEEFADNEELSYLYESMPYYEVCFAGGMSENQIRKQLEDYFDSYVDECKLTADTDVLSESLANTVHYYLKTRDGTVYTNYSDTKNEIKSSSVYLTVKDGVPEQKNLDGVFADNNIYFSSIRRNTFGQSFVNQTDGCELYAVFKQDSGVFGNMYEFYQNAESIGLTTCAALGVLMLVFAVVCLVIYAKNTGKYNEDGEIKLSFFDKIPTDLHFLLSAAMIVLFATAATIICAYGMSVVDVQSDLLQIPLNALIFTDAAVLLCAVTGGLSFMFFTMWVGSVARISKSGRGFFKGFVIAFFFRGCKRIFRFAVDKIIKPAFYQPKKLKKYAIAVLCALIIIDMIAFSLAVSAAYNDAEGLMFLSVFPVGLLNLYIAFYIINYIVKLDKIIIANENRTQPDINIQKLPVSLKTLYDNYALTNARLDEAIEKAVKDERMKTDLITNVSHDLKTPLTSVISYVDLLKRCEITDENARQYLSVLEEKSARLKTLVEDLVEASKASSGAVTLNKTGFDLTELVIQAVGEENDGFAACGLDLIMNEPTSRPAVFADSRKTYRAIENLFTNARKYSVTGSRVYVSVGTENNMGFMQIKNMSKQMLNISPDELTERFVRGDSSRTDGGSGLGLAIAKDLCTLQDGSLKIEIDGDLFKATVYLPLCGREK